jgi:hypothetical protein
MEEKKEKRELSDEIKDQIKAIKVLPGEVNFKGKLIDMREIKSVAVAKKLIEDGFPFLEVIGKKAPSPGSGAGSSSKT